MKALKAIKKIAAVGMGLAFLGTTVGGALALDLGDYPAPFATGTAYNGKIIVGAQASAIDIVGSVNIAASFTNIGGEGSVVIETPQGKVANAVPFDSYYANGTALDDDEFPMKGEDRKLDFDDGDTEWAFMTGYDDSDITEDLDVRITATEGEDECDPDEAITFSNFTYNYTDSSDKLENEIDRVDRRSGTVDFKYSFKLLGKSYYAISEDVNASETDMATMIDDIGDGLRLQLAYGNVDVSSGDVVDLAPYGYDGYSLKVIRITEESSGGDDGKITVALMKGDEQIGDSVSIDEDGSDTLYDDDADVDVDVYAEDVSWDAASSEYFAEIRFEAGELSEGDYLDSHHMWKLDSLSLDGTSAANAELAIGIVGEAPSKSTDDLDCIYDEGGYLYPGHALSLQNYLEVGFTGLTAPNTANFKIDLLNETKMKLIPDDDVTVVVGSDDYKGKELTFEYDAGEDTWNLTAVEGEDNDDVDNDLTLDDSEVYLDKDHKYVLTYNETDDVLFIQEPDDLVTNYIAISDFTALSWATDVLEDSDTNLSSGASGLKTSRTTDLGTELVNYDHYNRDATFKIVDDAVRYQVYAGQKVISSGNEVSLKVGDTSVVGTIKSVGAKPLPVGLAILDSELSSPEDVKDDNYIVVGGPCANAAAAALMGATPETCEEGFQAGEALIKLYESDGKYQLLVAGYNGEDTLLATKVLGAYSDYADELEGKTEVKVKGTKLADVVIEG